MRENTVVNSDICVNKKQLGATPLSNMNKWCNGKHRLKESQTQKSMHTFQRRPREGHGLLLLILLLLFSAI
jgi:hypothetical protein